MTFQQIANIGVIITIIGSIIVLYGNYGMQREAERFKQAEKDLINQNLKPFLERSYNDLFYSLHTLEDLPGFTKHDISQPIDENYERRAFRLRRFRLNVPERYYIYYPSKDFDRWRIVFFMLSTDIGFDKSNLHKIFENKESLALGLKLYDHMEVTRKNFMIFWNSIVEGKVGRNSPIDSLDQDVILTQEDFDKVQHLQTRAKYIYRNMDEIRKILERLNNDYNYSFRVFE